LLLAPLAPGEVTRALDDAREPRVGAKRLERGIVLEPVDVDSFPTEAMLERALEPFQAHVKLVLSRAQARELELAPAAARPLFERALERLDRLVDVALRPLLAGKTEQLLVALSVERGARGDGNQENGAHSAVGQRRQGAPSACHLSW